MYKISQDFFWQWKLSKNESILNFEKYAKEHKNFPVKLFLKYMWSQATFGKVLSKFSCHSDHKIK